MGDEESATMLLSFEDVVGVPVVATVSRIPSDRLPQSISQPILTVCKCRLNDKYVGHGIPDPLRRAWVRYLGPNAARNDQ